MIKNIIIFFSFFVLSACATTEPTAKKTESKPDTTTISKSQAANLELKSAVNSAVLFLNKDKWQYQKVTKEGSSTEFNFQIKDNRKGVIVGRMITETVTPDLQLLTRAAVANAAVLKRNFEISMVMKSFIWNWQLPQMVRHLQSMVSITQIKMAQHSF